MKLGYEALWYAEKRRNVHNYKIAHQKLEMFILSKIVMVSEKIEDVTSAYTLAYQTPTAASPTVKDSSILWKMGEGKLKELLHVHRLMPWTEKDLS